MEMKSCYTLPFICISCRKSFKKSAPDFKPFCLTDDEIGMVRFACPQCRKQLHFVGRYFKAPRSCDLKQWRKIEILFQQGWRADGYNLKPRTLHTARNYSAQRNELFKLRCRTIRQEGQIAKWRKMRKWPRVHLKEKSSTG